VFFMKTSEISFKIFGTCAVLCVVLTILGWCKIGDGIWFLDAFIGIVGGIALIVGIIALIWE